MPSTLIDSTDGNCTHRNDQRPEHIKSDNLLDGESLTLEICAECGARKLVLNRWSEGERVEVIF